MSPAPKIVHEGRGGYVEIEGFRYPIDHVEGGRFAIQFPAGNRSRRRDAHLAVLIALCRSEPDKWDLERRDGRVPRRGSRRSRRSAR